MRPHSRTPGSSASDGSPTNSPGCRSARARDRPASHRVVYGLRA
jgi:hypothetical protein